MTIRFRTLILIPVIWLVSLLASAQDTARHKFTAYIRLPLTSVFDYEGEKESNFRSLQNPEFGIGFHPTNKSEWCANLEYIPLKNRYQFELNYFSDSHRIERAYTYSLPTSGFYFRMQFDKRWFVFRRKMLRPFGGVSLPIVFAKENNVGVERLNFSNGLNSISKYFIRTSAISIYLGINLGLQFQYKRWTGLAYLSLTPLLFSASQINHGFYSRSQNFIGTTSIQLGYSF
ncbi:MAG TPA: hypothetical protein PK509_08595 [Catalimonadaceae bacterium]|nr:hypothetical protein [Catalimonadaceae bacterium]HPI11378.1 hypothetical protein [Catalimonadaceae bacterium]